VPGQAFAEAVLHREELGASHTMNNENEIARVVAGKILDEVLPQPKQEYTLEELLAELDRRWAQSHGR
jgi:phosphoserine phosphatase